MKIAYFILNRFDFDSRARLEVETLTGDGHTVDIIATVGGKLGDFLGSPIHRIAQPTWPSRKLRFAYYNIRAAIIASRLKPDFYHAVDLDTLPAACWARGKSKGKIIYESRELYTELEALKGRKFITSIWRQIERRYLRKTAAIIAINKSIANELQRRYAISEPNIIRNVAVKPSKIEPLDLRQKFNISAKNKVLIYLGILRSGQGFFRLLEILKFLPRVSLILVGEGPLLDAMKRFAKEISVSERVYFPGMIAPDDLLNFTAGADAGVLLMEDAALNNRLALPQKIFQYLQAGIPQIVSDLPEMAQFVNSEEIGLILPPVDAQESARRIEKFLTDEKLILAARSNCSRAASIHNWQQESQLLLQLYRNLQFD